MERLIGALKHALGFTACVSLAAAASGCYREKPASGKIDFVKVPESVALLVPESGLEALDFGATAVGSTRQIELLIGNIGPYPATEFGAKEDPEAPFGFKGGSFPGTGGTCSEDLAPEATCTIILTYSPTDAGPHTGKVKMEYVNGVVVFPLEIELLGTTGASLSFLPNPAETDFGTQAVGSVEARLITIKNTGILPAEELEELASEALSAPFSFTGGPYPGVNGTCTDLLAPDEECEIEVSFSPSSDGNFSRALVLSFATGEMPRTASHLLKGKTPAVFEISDAGEPAFDFQRRTSGSSTDKTLTLTNTGGSTATNIRESADDPLPQPFFFKGGTFPGEGGNCTATLSSGGSCTLVLAFAPALDPDLDVSTDFSEILTLDYDDGLGALTLAQPLSARAQIGWDDSLAVPPAARHLHSAVWTGTEMIVWGGQSGESLADGARYNPVSDTWIAINGMGAPTARSRHTAIWAHNLAQPKMIVWGGQRDDGAPLASGAMYDPQTDQWIPMATGPSARYGHTAIWDPVRRKMIVWGGAGASVHHAGLGYIFDPSTGASGSWSPISDGLAATPSGRAHHSAVWNGSEMIIWGGCIAKNAGAESCQPGSETNTGAIYSPATNTWTALSVTNAPAARALHSAVWTGTEMVIWGGATDTDGAGNLSPLSSGGIYTLAADQWDITPALNAPAARAGHLAFWTQKGMVIWGGLPNSGAGSILDLALTTWSSLPAGAPPASAQTAGIYTGNPEPRILVFGGRSNGGASSNLTATLVP